MSKTMGSTGTERKILTLKKRVAGADSLIKFYLIFMALGLRDMMVIKRILRYHRSITNDEIAV